MPSAFADKLNRLLVTSFVDNSIKTNTPILLARSPQLGKFLRLAEWNIKRGVEYEAIEAELRSDQERAGGPARPEAISGRQ